MSQIKAEIVGDAISQSGNRITSFLLTYPRIIHSELMTHRVFSRNSASCLSGDTVITVEKPSLLKKGFKNKHTTMTIKEIVDRWFTGDSKGRDMKQRLQTMSLRCLNENTGEFVTTKITNCFKQGLQDIYEVELKNGYKIKCTKNHRLFTSDGWKTLNDFSLTRSKSDLVSWNNNQTKIATNGFSLTTDFILSEKNKGKTLTQISKENDLNFKSVSGFCEKNKIFFKRMILENETVEYKNEDWLKTRLLEGLFSTEIAILCNTTSDRVKKQIKKFGLKGNRYDWSSRKEVWNKNKTYKQKESSLVNVRANAAKRKTPGSYKSYKDFNAKVKRFLKEVRSQVMEKYSYKCQLSGVSNNLELHHIVPVWYNKDLAFEVSNLLPINRELHRFLHSKNLDIEFMNYYNEGMSLNNFIDKYENVKLKLNDIKKPKGRGNTLVVRYFAIKTIKYLGQEETYDLEVNGPFHNFIANGVVVHNSRAIKFDKMVEAVENNPFIPMAWQKAHSGMQGSEYFDGGVVQHHISLWLEARNNAVNIAKKMANDTLYPDRNLTKQLCNRLLEPFMWHTTLVTSTTYSNFFELRCPSYQTPVTQLLLPAKSKKECIANHGNEENIEKLQNFSDLEWLKINQGQGEIHIMALAEAMYDAYNESVPNQLEKGFWYIPFENKINFTGKEWSELTPSDSEETWQDVAVKISTSMCARTSYTVVGEDKDFTYEKQIALHDRMVSQKPFHASPFEHCAKNMEDSSSYGNFTGWKQYRQFIENGEF